MKGITLTFAKRSITGVDALNNPTTTETEVIVDDCLIGPISEPLSAREHQAVQQNRAQVRIHLPKTFTGDVSDSIVEWSGKQFRVDSDGVEFMAENTPTRWNKYFRAEVVIT